MDQDAISRSDASDFKLGDWWVRPGRNELERPGDRQLVEARSMEVLVCLARHAPAVVSKETLLAEVWTDSPYVGDDAISHAIWELRKALGDSARHPAYIRTVPRKGYRLVAEILRPQGSPLPMAGVRIDHYDLREEIGRGAMGVVYEAVDRRLGRTVAVKFLAPELTRDPESCRRFEREARLAASLDHPNLATVHEIGETSEGHRYLVGAYYRGGSLKDLLAQGPVDPDEVLRLARQLVAGLGAAHERGIVHRDVKPANLLLDDHGTLKICDFGIAKLLGATDLTRTGAALGTPAYKSPEQARGREVDHRTDLWAVGVVCFELLTGRRPFDGEFEQAVVHAILSEMPRVLEDVRGRRVTAPWRSFIARALAKEPEERFQSAEEMAAALGRLDEARPPRLGASRRWLAAAAALVVLLLTLGVLSSRPPTPPISGENRKGLDHLSQGRTMWLRGLDPANRNAARDHLKRAVELLPESAVAKGSLAAFVAESYSITKNTKSRDEALALVRETRAIDPRSPLASAAESWILAMDQELEEAERKAQEAIEIEPRCDRREICDLAYLWLAEILWMRERADEAFEALDAGTRVGGGNIRCRLKRAELYKKLGREREAESEYLDVLDWDKEQTTALQGIAILYMEQERYNDAIEFYHRHYQMTQDPKTLNNIAYIHYENELWDEAIKTYREAHLGYQQAGESVPTPLTAIGDIYLAQGKKDEARPWFQQALDIFDSLEEPGIRRRCQRAVCLAKLGRVAEAEAEIGKQFEREEDFPDVLYYAARIYALKGDRETLLDLARQWIEKGQAPSRFLDDPAFIPYEGDEEYIRILKPQLFLAE